MSPKRPSARPGARPPASTTTARPSTARPSQPEHALPRSDAAPADSTRPGAAPKPSSLGSRPDPGASTARVSARRSTPPSTPPTGDGRAPKPALPARPVATPPSAKQREKSKATAHSEKSEQQRKRGKVAGTARFDTRPLAAGAPPPDSTRALRAAKENADETDVFSAAEVELGQAAGLGAWPDASAASEPAPAVARLALGSGADRRAQEAAVKGVQSLLSSDYYVRQYGAHGMRSLSADVDDYGLDPHVEERARPWLELLSTRYFRLTLEGAERVPKTGRALLVANRSGAVPWDGLMLRTALRMQRPELQPLRWLSEDAVIHYPFLGTFMNRLGAVRACPENAERLLGQDRLVAVFPEGAQGSHKLFKDRYRLQRFGRGGYVKLALKLGAPILPTAIIGAEEVNPLLARLGLFGRAENRDFLPITPTFPWLGPLGLLPAPVKWRVIIGEPVDLSAYGAEAAEDALLVHRLNEQIRAILQALVDQAQASRRSVLFG